MCSAPLDQMTALAAAGVAEARYPVDRECLTANACYDGMADFAAVAVRQSMRAEELSDSSSDKRLLLEHTEVVVYCHTLLRARDQCQCHHLEEAASSLDMRSALVLPVPLDYSPSEQPWVSLPQTWLTWVDLGVTEPKQHWLPEEESANQWQSSPAAVQPDSSSLYARKAVCSCP